MLILLNHAAALGSYLSAAWSLDGIRDILLAPLIEFFYGTTSAKLRGHLRHVKGTAKPGTSKNTDLRIVTICLS